MRWWQRILPPTKLERDLVWQCVLSAFATGTFLTGTAVYFTKVVGLSGAEVGLGMSIAAAVTLVLQLPMGRLADRAGRAKVLVLGHLPLAAVYLCAASGSGALWTTCAAVLLLGVFYAATDGTLAAVAGQLVPETVRASGIATAQTAVAVARLVAATGFGLLWYAVGPRVALLAVCAALLAAIPAGFAVLRKAAR